MNRQQKNLIIDILIIVVATSIAVSAMFTFKDWVNRNEAVRAVNHLGQLVLEYKNRYGSIPPQSYIDDVKNTLEGYVRVGDLQYRARWIDIDCSGDEILAYTEKFYHSPFSASGYIVLRLNGRVEWMDVKDFKALLTKQQSPLEVAVTERKQTDGK